MTRDESIPNDREELLPDSPPAPLSVADWELFWSVCDDPPALPDKLKQAINCRRKKNRDESTGG